MKNSIRSVLGFLGWLALCFAAATTGMIFPTGEWYAQLQKPTWNPPNQIFPIMWTLLYLLMAFAAWRVWKIHGFQKARLALTLFLIQLALNTLWTPLFFGYHHMGLAFIDIVLMIIAVAVTIVSFKPKDKIASFMLIPYLAWISFASVLNLSLWKLNR